MIQVQAPALAAEPDYSGYAQSLSQHLADGQPSSPVTAANPARVPFAIVCAARGCPPLAARPYRAASLDRRGQPALSGFIPWDWRLNQADLPPAR